MKTYLLKLLIVVLFVLTLFQPSFSVEKEWTVLVYAVTDSVLSSCVLADMDEMEMVGSDSNLEILVQLDRNDHSIRRYRIQKDDKPGKMTSPVVEYPEYTHPGEHQTLVDFVKWGVTRAPSKRVLLILHGCLGNLGYGEPSKIRKLQPTEKQLLEIAELSGANLTKKQELEKAKLLKDWRKERENGARYMGIRHMGFALTKIHQLLGHRIDIVGCDDSCDASIEKLAEYSTDVSHWIGSEGFLPSDDWPYDKVLGLLQVDPTTDNDTFCQRTVDEFALSYKAYCQLPYGFGATLTAFNLDNVHQLLSEIKELTVKLYKAVKVKTNRYRILDLRTRTFSLLSSDNLDFYDFMKGLSTLQLGDSEIQKSAQQLAKTMKKAMLAHWAGGRVYYRASGLSITLANWMGDYDLRKYQLLKWSKFSKWDKFMKRVWR